QRVVGSAVHAADGAPLVEDRAQPIAGSLPVGGVGGEVLGLGGQRLLAGGSRRALLVAALPVGGGRGVGVLHDHGEPSRQGVDITEHRGGRQGFGQRRRRGLDFAGVTAAGGQPLLQERDLGA